MKAKPKRSTKPHVQQLRKSVTMKYYPVSGRLKFINLKGDAEINIGPRGRRKVAVWLKSLGVRGWGRG